jgi:F-type H+-transporting ATPase subunit delta
MSAQTIARRYATALADVTLARGDSRPVQQELAAWQQMIESHANLREVFRNPTIALDQKRKVLSRLIQLSGAKETTANFLKVLLQNQRLTELGEINRKFAQVLDDRAGMVAATVTTARPVPAAAQAELEARLNALTGKKVRVDFQTDPDIIGGLTTRIGSTVYDGSVRSQLRQIREKMTG